jgi:hypothetical protein
MPEINNVTKFIRRHSKICLFISLCIVCFICIKIYRYSLPLPAKKWIYSNLEKIHIKDPTHFSFAVFCGSKISRLVFKGLLEQVDHDFDIAFAVDLGDAVLSGGKTHYHFFIKQIDDNLGIPLLTVLGDNELSGDGRELYSKIFGPFYYSFKIGKNYFLVLDNADKKGLSDKQMVWLENELKQSWECDSRIIFMHRPLYYSSENNNNQSMSKETSVKLTVLFLKYQATHIFASQINGFYEDDFKGIPYFLTGGAEKKSHNRHGKHGYFHFLKVNVEKKNIDVEFKKEFSSGFYRMKHFEYRPVVFLDYLIRVYWLELIFITFILLSCFIYIILKRKTAKKNGN